MSFLRVFSALLCLTAVVVAEEENFFIHRLVCAECQFGQQATVPVLKTALDQVSTMGTDFFDTLCAQVPPRAALQCKMLATLYEARYVELEKMLEEQNVCEQVLQCTEREMNALPNDSDERFCRICRFLVDLVFQRVGLESLLKEGEEAAVEICKQIGIIGASDCEAAVEEALSTVDVPTPQAMCTMLEFCPGTNEPSAKPVLPVA